MAYQEHFSVKEIIYVLVFFSHRLSESLFKHISAALRTYSLPMKAELQINGLFSRKFLPNAA